jgi:predicted negative regulator of RcsB-dependent stress response
MSEATKRIRRKDLHLRAPDEFVTLTGRVLDWSRANSQLVSGAAIALAVIVLIAAAWSWISSSREDRSARDFYAANELFKREQWDPAEKAFDALADDLPGTSYGRLARLYAARAALRAGRPADAATQLREFFAHPIDDKAVSQLAHMNLGSVLAEQGDLDGARGELNMALEIDGPARGEVTLELARVEELAGQKEKALETYQRYLADDPNAVARDLARARIVALGGTPPALPPQFPGGQPGLSVQ